MRLSENEIVALVLITRSEVPVHPHDLYEELGLQSESVSRIITRLKDKGLVERAGGEILLAGTPQQRHSSGLYYSPTCPLPCRRILSGRRVELLSRLDSHLRAWKPCRIDRYLQRYRLLTICRPSSPGNRQPLYAGQSLPLLLQLRHLAGAEGFRDCRSGNFRCCASSPGRHCSSKSYENSVLFKA